MKSRNTIPIIYIAVVKAKFPIKTGISFCSFAIKYKFPIPGQLNIVSKISDPEKEPRNDIKIIVTIGGALLLSP